MHDRFIQVLDLSDRSVVTVIELLSPANKVPNSRGRQEFLAKKHEVLRSDTHWMEIDLLRAGERSPIPAGKKAAYMVYVSRAMTDERRERLTWPIPIRERLPVVGVPLREKDADVPLDLQAVLEAVIEQGSYDLDFDYSKPPIFPLTGEDAIWAREGLASRAASQVPASTPKSE